MTLIGFPGAIFAVYVFHAELVDLVTEPEVQVELREVTLRCAYTFDTSSSIYQKYANSEEGALGAICGSAPLGVSFSYRVTNDDSIVRQLKGLRIIVEIPEIGEQNYGFAYDIEHVVQNRYDSVVERPWFVRALVPGVTDTYEALLLSDPREDLSGDTPFNEFRELVKQRGTSLANETYSFRLLGRFDHGDEIDLAECDYQFDAARIESFIGLPVDSQHAITGYCLGGNE